MEESKYYKSGEFAKKADVSIRTIRFYDKQGLLKPTFVNEAGYRFYSHQDFIKLQKILTLKSLGFSLEEIKNLTLGDNNKDLMQSLDLQLNLVRNKIQHLEYVETSLKEAKEHLYENTQVNWDQIIHLIHITNMEKDIVDQYKNSSNTKIRISLHKDYGTNPEGWFQWNYNQYHINSTSKVLELGCGNGELWKVNEEQLSSKTSILLSDISLGMLKDAKENLKYAKCNLRYQQFDCHKIPLREDFFDIIIANHMIFYLKERDKFYQEIQRVLKRDGYFYCSTYGKDHMKEITALVKEFDSGISLSEVYLFEIFGLENGKDELTSYFSLVELSLYEDYLIVDNPEALLDYILSCHGNQHEHLKNRYVEFKDFLTKRIQHEGFIKITKSAGTFKCQK
ncbi:MAG: transcriptional regulator, MerR family [Anaerocolumna sp.]|jgi:DNA-binding transcriptional MerR regulator|nr:transcriptional regulator, MerR family [Anaerocolumna sp.]